MYPNNTPLILNYLFLLILLYILFYFIVNKNPLEYFYPGVFGFDPYLYGSRTISSNIPPSAIGFPNPFSSCKPENNCFLGLPARTQIYQNMCQPEYGLYRQPIQLQDDCLKSLSPYYNPELH